MIVPFTESKSGSGPPGFRGKLIVVYAIFETKKNDVLIKDIILVSIREIERVTK